MNGDSTQRGGLVLVIDDEANIRESIQKALDRSGYEVVTSPDAFHALSWLETRSADLILCDIRMPGMDGLELLSKIKEGDPAAAVVMITGYGSIESAVASIKAGAEDYISKPFRPHELRAVVAKLLNRKRLAEENVLLKRELLKSQGPIFLLGLWRRSLVAVELASFLAVVGVLAERVNILLPSLMRLDPLRGEAAYVPSTAEITMVAAVYAIGLLIFCFFAYALGRLGKEKPEWAVETHAALRLGEINLPAPEGGGRR